MLKPIRKTGRVSSLIISNLCSNGLYFLLPQAGVDAHFRSLALRHMPANLQGLGPGGLAGGPSGLGGGPNLDEHVFLRVVRDVTAVVEEETDEAGEEVVDLKAGDQHVMRYRPLVGLIDSGDVVLI